MSVLECAYDYPNIEAKQKLNSLIGIDENRQRLEKGLKLILNPSSLIDWSNTLYNRKINALELLLDRPPLFILTGDVGVGKTALAESIGDAVARSEDISVYLYRLSLASRGSGLVGEMTKLISSAFSQIIEEVNKCKNKNGSFNAGYILLIDEADALVQSRETNEMHHEDRAGVNAVIREIDNLTTKKLPIAVIMCTNRLLAIDPAIQRRAADIIKFSRPNGERIKTVFFDALNDIGFTEDQIDQLVKVTDKANHNGVGFTFSDLTQRFIARLILEAYPDKRISFDLALNILQSIKPTPIFKHENG